MIQCKGSETDDPDIPLLLSVPGVRWGARLHARRRDRADRAVLIAADGRRSLTEPVEALYPHRLAQDPQPLRD
jgi:hypothetical protein